MKNQFEIDRSVHHILAGTGGRIGTEFFASLTEHFAKEFDVHLAFIAKCDFRNSSQARMLAMWHDGSLIAPFDYDVRDTPCETMRTAREFIHYSTGLQDLFPKDTWLQEFDANSFLAIPIVDDDRIIGHMGVMNREPIKHIAILTEVIKVFADRTAAEIHWQRTEQRLKDSHGELEQDFEQRTNQLNSLLETSTDAIVTIDANSQILFVNDAAIKILGYQSAELVGQSITQVIPESYRAKHLEAMGNFIKSEQKTISWEAQEFRARHRSGREVPVEISLSATRDAGGSHVFTGIIRDISERKRMEEELYRRQERLRVITDSIPAFISYIDTDHRYQFVNAEYERYSGVPREQIVGHTIRELWGDEMFESTFEHVQAALSGERRTLVLHLPAIKPGTTRRHVQVELVPNRDRSGEVVGYYVLGSDISDRVRTEAKLQERLEFERLISMTSARFVRIPLNQIDSAIDSALGQLGQFFHVDRCAICQVSSDETVVPTHVWTADRIDKKQNAFPQGALERMASEWRQGKSATILSWIDEIPDEDRQLVQKIGIKSTVTVPLLVGGHLFGGMGMSSFTKELNWSKDAMERMRFVGEVFANVLMRKHAEEQITRHRKELTHVARLRTMGEMAAGLAHELNQPLTAIAAYSDGVKLRINSGEASVKELQTIVEKISNDAHRAGQIIQRLRQFVRNRDAVRLPVNINELVSEVCEFLENEIAHNEVAIELNLDHDLAHAHADSIEIQQALVNLIRNAIEAVCDSSTAYERLIKVTTSMGNDESIMVIVEDSGPGITQDKRQHVFEPFFTSKSHGLGMGLAVTQTVLQANQGRIWIEEPADRGAKICFSLPICDEVPVDVK